MLPKAWHVQVSYYRGRYLMYNNDFVRARQELLRAFGMANREREYVENKQRILRYLIPVEMVNGRFPSQSLLQNYDLLEYSEVTDACLKGNMQGLEQAISTNMDQFI